MTDWLLETFKLVAQLAGALGISWLTVQWALGRYKSEKMWERESAAITDLVEALGEIEGALNFWLRIEVEDANYTDEWLEYRAARYRRAREKFDGVSAVASLILPDELAGQLASFVEVMETSADEFDYIVTNYENQLAALSPLRQSVVAYGRTRLLRRRVVSP